MNSADINTVAKNNTGVFVRGHGLSVVVPDLALLDVGIEVRSSDVATGLSEANRAMDKIYDVLQDRSVDEDDIQTTNFSIQPIYVTEERGSKSSRYYEQVLVGYKVVNQLEVKIRDLSSDSDAIGITIDRVTDAGGDAVRIRGISFTVEDSSEHKKLARDAAVVDALSKAGQLAKASEVKLGKLVYLSEVNNQSAPLPRSAMMMRAESAAPTTTISAGTLDVQVIVDAVFEID